MYEISNKIILITGAANGIGAEVVKIFLDEGAKHGKITVLCLMVSKVQSKKNGDHRETYYPSPVAAVMPACQVTVLDIDEESGKCLQETLCHKSGEDKIKFIKCDVTKEDQLFGAFDAVVDQYGYVDIVVNNAGLADESTMDSIRKEIEVNYIAVVQGTLKALAIMRSDKGGKGGTIINVSSIASLCQLYPALFVYFGTKSAVMQFSNCIGKQEYYSTTGVRVLTVCVGATNTDMINNARSFDEQLNKPIQEGIISLSIQEKDKAALGIVQALKYGESGSTWMVENNNPALDVTENVKKAYGIMSEPLKKSF